MSTENNNSQASDLRKAPTIGEVVSGALASADATKNVGENGIILALIALVSEQHRIAGALERIADHLDLLCEHGTDISGDPTSAMRIIPLN